MNTITLHNYFFEKDAEFYFTPLELATYMRLVDRCYRLRWKNPFNLATEELLFKLRLRTKDPLDTARNRLKQAGLLDYKNGNGRGQTTQYWLTEPDASPQMMEKREEKNPTLSPTLSPPVLPHLIPTQTPTVHKTKLNQTREGERAPTKSKKQFIPPGLDEVLAYAAELEQNPKNTGAQTEAPRFIDHFESNGWLISGKTPMASWRAAFRSWMGRRSNFQSHTHNSTAPIGAGYNLSAKIAENNKPKC
jgi:hypothetical protein